MALSDFSAVIVAHALIDQREVKTALRHKTQANTHNRANAVSRQRRHEHRVLPQGTNAVEAHHQGHNHCRGKTHIAPKEAKRHQPNHYTRSEEHTSELQSRGHLVCRLLPEKKKHTTRRIVRTLASHFP